MNSAYSSDSPGEVEDEGLLRSHASSESLAFSREDEERITSKVDFRILPFLMLGYLFQQLDKSTLMYASVFGLVDDVKLVGKQLSWLGSILYVAQLMAQPVAAMLLVKYPLGKATAMAISLWGLTLFAMSYARTFRALLCCRFVLGAFESIIAPACLAVTQMWYKRKRQTSRVSCWHAMNGIAPMVGAILCYILGHLERPGVYTYQIIFFACGLLTFSLSIPVWKLLPDTPMQAPFLTHEEKLILTKRLHAAPTDTSAKQWKWEQVIECCKDPKTWCWVAMHTCLAIPSGGLGVFGGLIIKDFGFDKFQTILFNIPFGIIVLMAIFSMTWYATRGNKGPVMSALCCVPMLGCAILLLTPRTGGYMSLLIFAYATIQVQSAVVPLNLSWQSQNTAGETKKQCTTAMMFIGSCFGNVMGPLLFDPGQAPEYRFGLVSCFCMYAVVGTIASFTSFYLGRLNRRRGGPDQGYRAARAKYRIEDGHEQNEGANVAADVTDLLDTKFRYVT